MLSGGGLESYMDEANKTNCACSFLCITTLMRAQAMLVVRAERMADRNKIIRNARMSIYSYFSKHDCDILAAAMLFYL